MTNPDIKHSSTAILALGALGVVYGDIGTSPLYTIREIFSASTGIALTADNIVGAISAVFWALMLVVTLKYVILILRANNRGEGGVMALLALALTSATEQQKKWLLLLGVVGAALFYGDSVLTPAISVLSAIEGLQIIRPELASYVMPLSVIILLTLFAAQRFGTHAVGKLFGPVLIIWFGMLGAIGVWHILHEPAILAALNPTHAYTFLVARGSGVFLAVGAIVLALTGAEALYADMGHFGKPAIRIAWTGLVFPALALNYMGQGALLLHDPTAVSNPFYLSFPQVVLLPVIMLATLATIIASQAVISGAYSMTRQAIQLGFLPRMRIIHTSATESGQIYLPGVNWLLLVAVLAVTISFQSSSALATAYGIAVTGTMLITTILTFFVIRQGWHYPLWLAVTATGFFLTLDSLLLVSCSVKFMQGGWFPVLIGGIMLLLMWTWKQGREILLDCIRQNDPSLQSFVEMMASSKLPRIDRTAVFLVSNPHSVPQALMHNLKHNHVLHQTNLILTVEYTDTPVIATEARLKFHALGDGFWQMTLRYGFMEHPDIPKALQECHLPDIQFDPFTTSYFLSREVVVPSVGGRMAKWRESLFATMSRNAGSVVEYFNIPVNSVIELGSRVHI